MEIERCYKPWLACLQDDSRPNISCAFVDRLSAEKGVMVSANGFLMTLIPVALAPDEQTGCIHRRLLQYAWSLTTGKRSVSITLDGEWVVMPDESRHKNHFATIQYPNWRRIVPPMDSVGTEPTRRAILGITPKLLSTAAKVLDMRDLVRVHFCKDNGPMVITDRRLETDPDLPYGVVMPGRITGDHADEAITGRNVRAVAAA